MEEASEVLGLLEAVVHCPGLEADERMSGCGQEESASTRALPASISDRVAGSARSADLGRPPRTSADLFGPRAWLMSPRTSETCTRPWRV